MAAATVADAAGMTFAEYLDEAVLQPLAMSTTELERVAGASDVEHRRRPDRFVLEVRRPRLISEPTASEPRHRSSRPHRHHPGVGRFSPCPWGLGFEVRGTKQPHWTGTTNSPQTFGHFGGAGTFLWVDPAVGVACLALTDRPFDEWADEALRAWPALSDAVLAEAAA